MANELWYALKIRPGFQTIVAERLRELNLEIFVPDQATYVYCRWALENRSVIAGIPGVLDVLGTPLPKPVEGRIVTHDQKTNRF